MVKEFDENSVTIRNQIYDVPQGMTILKEGEINLDMYKILKGHVEMYTGYGTENEVLLGLLGPGTCFGEFGILTKKPAIYTIIAYSNLKILRVTEELMMDFMKANPENVLQIMKNMANNMMRMQHQIGQLTTEIAELSNDLNNSENYKTSDMIKNMLRSYAIYDNNSSGDEQTDNVPGMKYLDKEHRQKSLARP
ncbi:cNMP binding domain-containing protein [Butyrivibrio proteoclasticus B316]|uniref:cNMP binding domain-containing protein n=1 Tax=Butyrivibrio proteoclasticus (strain ATCC 51982 / DSM 14932 / B316) TaxID=515622 RepID=E0RUX5_BUTPB|nr:Crp/Fnr family transcriptional regulator [Butyrivibrio proteoclasticus]ADL34166.1 cNMP binding domain-containing protein [Butyrivibrio proteoclasticus B316]